MGRVAVQPQSCQLPIPPVVFADCGSQQDDKASASEAGRERRNSEAGWQCEWLGGQGSRLRCALGARARSPHVDSQ